MNSSYSRYTFVGFVYGLAPVKMNAGNFKFNYSFLVCFLNQIESLVKLLISKILVLIKLPYYYSCLPKEVFIVANATSNFSELILVLIYDIGTNVSALSNLIYQEMTQVFSSCLEI